MPIPIPVLEEDAIELVIFSRIARAQIHSHVLGAVGVDEETVDLPRFRGDFAIGTGHSMRYTVPFNAHEAGLDFEILGLVVVEV